MARKVRIQNPAGIFGFLIIYTLPIALMALTGNAVAAAFHNPYGSIPTNATPGDRMFANYFRNETRKLAEGCLADVHTIEDWKQRRPQLRRQLFEMLGLDPLPPRSDLKATITGTIDQPEFTVEKLHFQSMPNLS